MPKIIELNRNSLEPGCEKVRMLADEYLHDELIIQGESEFTKEFELSEEERLFIDSHISGCKDCFDFIETNSEYLAEVRLAEYVPEISISQSVMDRIIENKMIVDKPPKRRRIFPVGLVSAAAVVIIMFALFKGGPLSIFMKADQKINNINTDNSVTEIAKADESFIFAATGENGETEEIAFTGALDSGYIIPGSMDAEVPKNAYEAEDNDTPIMPAAAPMPRIMPEAIAEEEAAIEPVNDAAPIGILLGGMTYVDFMEINSDLTFSKIYKLNYVDILVNHADILTGIEIYRAESAGNYVIFEKKYEETLKQNMLDNNISCDEWYIGKIDTEGETGYIGIIYYMS